jgi:hypothetical protein
MGVGARHAREWSGDFSPQLCGWPILASNYSRINGDCPSLLTAGNYSCINGECPSPLMAGQSR